MFCSDCGIAMCGDCTANWHNRNKLYKNHSLVPITDADTLKANVADRFSEPRKEEKCSASTQGNGVNFIVLNATSSHALLVS